MKKDFYFSKKSFDYRLNNDFLDEEVICEVMIEGRYHKFTEQIDHGEPPLSMWDDLIFIGTEEADRCRYTKARKASIV